MFNKFTIDPHGTPARARLSALVGRMNVVQITGPLDAGIDGITTDSRKVGSRCMFVASKGESADGHDFIQQAVERGASAVVVEEGKYDETLRRLLNPAWIQHNAVTVLVVKDTRCAVAELADRFYGSPASRLRLVGITGTNGKTTTSLLLRSALESAGEKTGLIGTISYRIGGVETPAGFTTPPAEELHRILAEMADAGCSHAVMEVSSHALSLKRVHGIGFEVSIFTNLSRDHLDFHGDMTGYREAKKLLFSSHTRRFGLVNRDDQAWEHMAEPLGRKLITYGTGPRCSFRMMETSSGKNGIRCAVRRRGRLYSIVSPLVGAFNAANLTAAFAAGILLGADEDRVLRGLRKVRSVPGRFERIASIDGVLAIVDYSHTPDALERAIVSARALAAPGGRIITVFGCGGDRDHGKRPIMGGIAAGLSDLTIVTSDNPRGEEPERIIDEILEGAENSSAVLRKSDRRRAIRLALEKAHPGDIVLIAGKGHETYQLQNGRKRHFDDREVVREYFEANRGGSRQ